MDVADLVTRCGGVSTWDELTSQVTDHRVKRAVAAGEIVRLARGRYGLPSTDEHRAEAHRRTAIVSHLSAAAVHEWPVKWPATQPWMTVARKRHLAAEDRQGLHVVYRDLAHHEHRDGVTTPVRTVLDCAMRLPFDEALAVADSALRTRSLTRTELRRAVAGLRGIGSPEARAVVAAADRRAANPFESVLRAIALGIEGLDLVPQLRITDTGLFATVDLGDERLQLAIEAEGFQSHGTRRALDRDCRRYTELEVFGWHVLRFSWEDVMLRPAWVRWAIESWVQRHRDGRHPSRPPSRQAQAG